MGTPEANFEDVVSSFLEPMAKARGVSVHRTIEPSYHTAVLDADGVRVLLENERGAVWLSVGATGSTQSWSIDHLSSLFPRVRELGGVQRFSLEAQIEFVRERWNELREMFGAANLEHTTQQLKSHIGANLQWKP